MTELGSRNVTVTQLILAVVGELFLFVGWIAIDRLANEKRTTQIEERLNAIYNQLPQIRAQEADQEKRLRDLEHKYPNGGLNHA